MYLSNQPKVIILAAHLLQKNYDALSEYYAIFLPQTNLIYRTHFISGLGIFSRTLMESNEFY